MREETADFFCNLCFTTLFQKLVVSSGGQATVRASISLWADADHAKAALVDFNQKLTL